MSSETTLKKHCERCEKMFEIPLGRNERQNALTLMTIGKRRSMCFECIALVEAERIADEQQRKEARITYNRQRMLENSGIPSRYRSDAEDLAGFEWPQKSKIQATVNTWLEGFPADGEPLNYPSLLVYSQNNGVGKTRLVCALLKEILGRHIPDDWRQVSPYKFIGMPDLRLNLQMGLRFQAEKPTDQVYEECANVWLLVLDDVGKEGTYRADDADVYYKLINDRYNANRPVIITSNLRPGTPWVEGGLTLEGLMGLSTVSRLREMCQGNIIELGGEDRR